MSSNFRHLLFYAFGFDHPRTQTTPDELEYLASSAAGRKTLVEIGVFEGVASAVLRNAMSRDGTLFLIDPFPAGRLGFSVQSFVARREVSKISNGNAIFLRDFSYNAVKTWSIPVNFLYYDAHNDYDGVRRDFEAWSPFLSDDGLFLIHTSRSSPAKFVPPDTGTVRFVTELESLFSDYQIVAQVDSISAVQRRKRS